MNKRLALGVGTAAVAATLAGASPAAAALAQDALATAPVQYATTVPVAEIPTTVPASTALVNAVPEDVQLVGDKLYPVGDLRVTVTSRYQDEARFVLHLPQTARLVPGQQCVLLDWNLSQWLCEGTRLEAGESATTTLQVRSILEQEDHGKDVGYVQGLANNNERSEKIWFDIKWPAA
ncbi:hypothetical protein [Actinoplanes couchii]|uniref:Uncharacterized protein n=1 Tax=Actinoplanes couchii TaxID=403638 RepID=A0ABQ3XP75_9ACTN|nr:hypothetical protein [Actinoplanes couchii]MDR6315891.1 hypothetical protein [Actinoplanes couchii]GID60312.1 hypothetical protein Aco03nite_087160 [Actinoplanes couchii]